MKIVLILILFFVLLECNESKNEAQRDNFEKTENIGMKGNNELVQSSFELKEKVIIEGDTAAYNSLSTASLDNSEESFLPWALIMANKYEYSQAFLDVYFCLNSMSSEFDKNNTRSLKLLDNKTREMALSYLKKAADKKHPQAMSILGQYFIDGIYLEKNSEKGNLLKNESEILFKKLYHHKIDSIGQ
jgi:TPR repeat protein